MYSAVLTGTDMVWSIHAQGHTPDHAMFRARATAAKRGICEGFYLIQTQEAGKIIVSEFGAWYTSSHLPA